MTASVPAAHVLVVDNLHGALRGSASQLDPLDRRWTIETTADAADAMRRLAETRWDAVIAHDDLDGLEGTALLAAARTQQPSAARVLVVGTEAARGVVGRAISVAHRVLEGVPTARALTAVLRVLTLPELMAPTALRDTIGAIDILPSAGGIARQLHDIVADERAGAAEVGALLRRDPGVASKVLHLANAGFAGATTPISDLDQAAALLGMELLAEVVLLSLAFEAAVQLGASMYAVEVARRHGVAAARAAARIPGLPAHARIAGLLLDVGLPLMALTWPTEHDKLRRVARAEKESLSVLERDTFGVTHAEAGGYLLRRWSTPLEVVAAVAGHHFVPLADRPDPRALGFVLHHRVQLEGGPGVDPLHPICSDPLPDWVTEARMSD